MNISKIVIKIGIVIIILLLTVPTTYKIIKNHRSNLIKVSESKIIEAAEKCSYEEKCLDKKITLKELYDNKYLETMYNPISKEAYNEESYVELKGGKFVFREKSN